MNQQDTEHSWWQALKQAREEKGVSIQKAAEDTRIMARYLELLEEGDLLQIPAVYDKLFFKSYLKYLGLNEDMYYPLFTAYREQVRVERTTKIMNYSDQEQKADHKSHLRTLGIILPIIISLGLIWFLINNTLSIEKESEQPVTEIAVEDIVHEMQKAELAVKDSIKADSIAAQKSGQFTVNLKGNERTWFRVIRDGKDTLEYTLKSGSRMDLSAAEKLEFLIGRADGLAFTVAGTTTDSLGRAEEVVRYLLIDSTGIVTKRLVQPKPKTEEKSEQQPAAEDSTNVE
jgi:cytoskeletal protein RodZ